MAPALLQAFLTLPSAFLIPSPLPLHSVGFQRLLILSPQHFPLPHNLLALDEEGTFEVSTQLKMTHDIQFLALRLSSKELLSYVYPLPPHVYS